MGRAMYVWVVVIISFICCVDETFSAAGYIAGSRQRSEFAEKTERVVPGVIYIKFKEGVTPNAAGLSKASGALHRALAANGISLLRPVIPPSDALAKSAALPDPVGLSRVFYGIIPENMNPAAVAAQVVRLEGIEYAEPKRLQRILETPNDALIGNQASVLTRLNLYTGWSLGKGNPSVVIAFVDGGTDWRHEDLLQNVHINSGEDVNKNGQYDAGDRNGIDDDGNGYIDDVVGWNFANGTNDPTGLPVTPNNANHGTATAGLACAVTNNGKGVAGSSWNCSLLPVNASHPTLDDYLGDTYEGIIYAYRTGAKVISCSWGVYGRASLFEQDVINAATAAGALLVVAAGNENGNNDLAAHYPSNYRNVLAVGATNVGDDTKASFSNYGTSVSVYAPGVSMFVALAGGVYGFWGSGTSFSTPLVAGIAGIVRAAHPTWSPAQISGQVQATADPIDALNPTYAGLLGHGRVNLARALTESHAVLNVDRISVRTPAGKTLFIQGDTLLLNMDFNNVMAIPASDVQVSIAASSPVLQVLGGTASIPSVAPGQTVSVPAFRLVVAPLSAATEVVISIRWVLNGNDHDAAATRVMVFPTMPLWMPLPVQAWTALFSVRAVDTKVVWACGGNTIGSDPVVIRTSDGGATWLDATGNLPPADLYCVAGIDSLRGWVGTAEGRIYASMDGGRTWKEQAYPGVQTPFINGIWMFSDGKGYAQGDPVGTTGKFIVLRTTNYGTTWEHLPSEPVGEAGEAGWNNSFWWTDPLHGWFGTNKSKVWKTTDGGATWAWGSSGGVNSYGVAFFDAANGVAIHDAGTLARTSSGGSSWSVLPGMTTDSYVAVTAGPGVSSGWISTPGQIFRTRNFGVGWASEAFYPTAGDVTHMSAADSTIAYAVTSGGEILKYERQTVTGVTPSEEPAVPQAFSLEQNYPNPFNPTTVVSCQLPVASRVRIVVYDLLGREVATLIDENKPAGVHTVQFDASGLASGVYLYRLLAGTYVETRKMALVR